MKKREGRKATPSLLSLLTYILAVAFLALSLFTFGHISRLWIRISGRRLSDDRFRNGRVVGQSGLWHISSGTTRVRSSRICRDGGGRSDRCIAISIKRRTGPYRGLLGFFQLLKLFALIALHQSFDIGRYRRNARESFPRLVLHKRDHECIEIR